MVKTSTKANLNQGKQRYKFVLRIVFSVLNAENFTKTLSNHSQNIQYL
jgi:hypothetical protein